MFMFTKKYQYINKTQFFTLFFFLLELVIPTANTLAVPIPKTHQSVSTKNNDDIENPIFKLPFEHGKLTILFTFVLEIHIIYLFYLLQ